MADCGALLDETRRIAETEGCILERSQKTKLLASTFLSFAGLGTSDALIEFLVRRGKISIEHFVSSM